jgi:hypothetical protein
VVVLRETLWCWLVRRSSEWALAVFRGRFVAMRERFVTIRPPLGMNVGVPFDMRTELPGSA